MGLDITAYSNLTAVGIHTDKPWCEDEQHIKAYAYDSFPHSFRGIPVLNTRTVSGFGGDSVFIEGGCYATTKNTAIHDFRAGSYIGYGAWRSDLREQFNSELNPDGPFYELIWFADNEGTIGELAAAALLADFQAQAAMYAPPAEWADYYREKYDDWTRACKLAADGGLIAFH